MGTGPVEGNKPQPEATGETPDANNHEETLETVTHRAALEAGTVSPPLETIATSCTQNPAYAPRSEKIAIGDVNGDGYTDVSVPDCMQDHFRIGSDNFGYVYYGLKPAPNSRYYTPVDPTKQPESQESDVGFYKISAFSLERHDVYMGGQVYASDDARVTTSVFGDSRSAADSQFQERFFVKWEDVNLQEVINKQKQTDCTNCERVVRTADGTFYYSPDSGFYRIPQHVVDNLDF